jgi:microsomal epoxide hydrolase
MIPAPFTISVTDEVLSDVRRRVKATNWPNDLDNEDWRYGVNTAYLRDVADYWVNSYDWRETERAINEFEHYRVPVDGIPIHFIKMRGNGPAPIPLILSHGWPWTFWDMRKVIRPLADPGAFGGDPKDAFDVIVPSLPGFGFSTPLPRTKVNFWVTADLWHRLMTEVLGYQKYAAAGGDWGALVSTQLGHKYASSLYGIHLAQSIPLGLFDGETPWDLLRNRMPKNLPPELQSAMIKYFRPKAVHVMAQVIEPQTLSYGLHDSPVALLAWLLQRRRDWGETHGDVESVFPRDHLITTAMIYWVTNSFSTSARYYADGARYPWQPSHPRSPMVEAPTGLTFLGGEFPPGTDMANRIDAFKASPAAGWYNLHYTKAHPTGGHFAHFENPEACIGDIRATFRDLR